MSERRKIKWVRAEDVRWGTPPTRVPQRPRKVPALTGKRLILNAPDGFIYDARAASEVYFDDDGRMVVDVVTEKAWYREQITGKQALATTWPTIYVWVE